MPAVIDWLTPLNCAAPPIWPAAAVGEFWKVPFFPLLVESAALSLASFPRCQTGLKLESQAADGVFRGGRWRD